MIKPNELRVNNWYTSTKFNKPVRCEMADFLEIYSRADGATPDEKNVAELFQPMVLKPDWLDEYEQAKKEYFGYVIDILPFDTEYKKIIIDLSQGIMIRAGDLNQPREKDEIVVLFNINVRGKLHVHQLQNLYFALTGEEL